jgi:transposase
MEFDNEMKTTIKTIAIQDYFERACPLCPSKELVIKDSRVRIIPDLGSLLEKVVIHLEVKTYQCKACKAIFTPEHPFFPPKYEYSKAIIEYALFHYHYRNTSGNVIAQDLRLFHQVDVPEATVYSWLKAHSPQFVKARLKNNEEALPESIKVVSLDGSYVSVAKELIGKKKGVESFSVTQLDDGRFLLMWWE